MGVFYKDICEDHKYIPFWKWRRQIITDNLFIGVTAMFEKTCATTQKNVVVFLICILKKRKNVHSFRDHSVNSVWVSSFFTARQQIIGYSVTWKVDQPLQ